MKGGEVARWKKHGFIVDTRGLAVFVKENACFLCLFQCKQTFLTKNFLLFIYLLNFYNILSTLKHLPFTPYSIG